MSFTGDYSEIADAQLDALETGGDATLYDAVLDAIELIFRVPGQAQALSDRHNHRGRHTNASARCRPPTVQSLLEYRCGRELKRFSRIRSCLRVGAG